MVYRLCNPLKSNSFFLFGARGTGKSTLIQKNFSKKSIYFDLLEDETYDRLLQGHKIIEEISAQKKYEWIIIDEVQRLPKLLNTVHRMIEKHKQKFALTGSSSRKLKRGSANLLAGRAFVNTLFPLTSIELDKNFNLNETLKWGSLPKITALNSDDEKRAYLRAYALTYIKEEIQMEQIVRKLEPFREFLSVAAQMSGKLVNYSAIAREVGAQVPTVQTYFQILEETYIGFFLPHFHRSVRKSQIETPKFYLFDNGIKRALESSLTGDIAPGTSYYGDLFESFIVQEVFRLNQYWEKDFRLSFFRTKSGVEVDLVLTQGKKTILIEIKSSKQIDDVEVRQFSRIQNDFGQQVKSFFISQDQFERNIEGVNCWPWTKFLKEFKNM